MQDYAYRHELDDDAFPEHAFGPGAFGIFAELRPAGADRRIPSDRGADLSLLVVFRLRDEAAADAVWRLEIEHLDAGQTRVRRIDLVDPPADGNVSETVKPPANVQLPPGMIYRGAFWADVSELLRSGILSSASAARVTYANQSAVLRVPVPAAAAD